MVFPDQEMCRINPLHQSYHLFSSHGTAVHQSRFMLGLRRENNKRSGEWKLTITIRSPVEQIQGPCLQFKLHARITRRTTHATEIATSCHCREHLKFVAVLGQHIGQTPRFCTKAGGTTAASLPATHLNYAKVERMNSWLAQNYTRRREKNVAACMHEPFKLCISGHSLHCFFAQSKVRLWQGI